MPDVKSDKPKEKKREAKAAEVRRAIETHQPPPAQAVEPQADGVSK